MDENTSQVHEPQLKRLPRDVFIEEVAWLADGGDTLDNISRRLHTNPKAMRKRLTDAGRLDLLHRITPISLRDQRAEHAA